MSFDRTTDEVEISGALAYERGHLTQVLQQGQSPPQTFNGRYLALTKPSVAAGVLLLAVTVYPGRRWLRMRL